MISSPAGMRVLVADDDLEGRRSLVLVLASLGHVVVAEATTGREAVDQVRASTPDVALLDVHMPDGSGIDAAKAIALDSPATAVVLFTADDSISLSDREVVETAAISFLAKPTPKHALDSALRLAVSRARALAEAHDALARRKIVERAKGIIMRRTGNSEEDAYRILQRKSQDTSTPMIDIARSVIASEPT